MRTKALMVQGTASSAGKSLIVAALCRIFKQDGLRVAPFKSQNMALNSFVTLEGGEIGRAQAVQAEAAGIEPSVDMNPILLKPEGDDHCQIVVLGKVWKTLEAGEYYDHKQELMAVVRESFQHLGSQYDFLVIEGAGSPAEPNLVERDIVNMAVAQLAQAPVLLVGDIERGGVFASIIGTLELLQQNERALIKGLIINKFRGDIRILQPGLDFLTQRTGLPVVGVLPYFHDLRIAQEDSVYLNERLDRGPPTPNSLDIAVIHLPHTANYDDFDPLEAEAGVHLRYVREPWQLGKPDLLILPGTKSTVKDLLYLRARGLADAVAMLASQQVPVIGICGGYQMLGRKIFDPEHIESPVYEVDGLGILPVSTIFRPHKATFQVAAKVTEPRGLLEGLGGEAVGGYEIHMGETHGEGVLQPLLIIERSGNPVSHPDGAISPDGLIMGTYLHGIFDHLSFRRGILGRLMERKGLPPFFGPPSLSKDQEYDRLASLVRQHLAMGKIYEICGLEKKA